MHDDHLLDHNISRGFAFAIALTSVTLVAEVTGGFWTNSLALLSDAAHVFMDLFALSLSLAAIRLAARPVSDRRTYGWHRAEILASLINGATLLIIAVGILHEAWGRFQHPEPVKSREMFVIAAVGLAMNLIAARLLHGHAHHDLNVRSAFLHVLGDALASVGVIIGGLIMLQTGWYVVDSLISAGIALIIGWGALRILREAGHILLEGVPPHINLQQVVARITDQEGVNDVHQLHVWSICSHITALSAHIGLHPDYLHRQGEVIGRIEAMLDHDFHITRTTLQGQCHRCANGDTLLPLRHRPRVADHEHDHAHRHP
ncbi:MAG: cation diffusion facilitator family transporter [Trichloromonas sp.]|jgi:cobalt-zinc-cadmium efflux system protein|nr:cation diffusion facilitator family transporter [Trichloromonas sp.]